MTNWIDICPSAEFLPGQSRLVEIDELRIAVFNLGGEFHAIEDVCTHDGSPLLGCGLNADELVNGNEIMCPRHGARFSILTGEPLCPPAYEPVTTFPVRIEHGVVQTRDHRDD